MKICVSFSESEVPIGDALKRFSKHADYLYLDGDMGCVVFVEPDDWLLEELENRGVNYKILD